MIATAPTLDSRIAAFAAAVRAQLADLPADDVDDLVDGLAADLAEQASEVEAFELPDPVAYAAELRSAAGLPERVDAAARRPSVWSRMRGLGADAVRGIRSSAAGAWLVDLLVALRPVWWIARGWVLYALIAPLLGIWSGIVGFPWQSTWGWVLLAALVLLSIQWGRGRWAPVVWLRVVRTVVSVVTAIALPFVAAGAVASIQAMISYTRNVASSGDAYTPGLAVDGMRVRNIFAYDADGNPIPAVQLFDQDGRPLATVGVEGQRADWPVDYYFDGGGGPVPVAVTVPGRGSVWNIYPLNEAPASYGGVVSPTDAVTPAFPFATASAVPQTAVPEPSPTPTDAVTPPAEQGVTSDSAASGAEG
ncbi:hypothetical protein IF188_17400 [Microbacterium sp. NEAU-LLC]|uniref:Uncharacterized protein n=1 Tax=Microbacterium helvum TaxID=2773713 RepID=A0ABR8NS51_9MICO|nr:hypothetical protein [Microbacterium helvum]MBD3943471.1 hypothetical protein [Microbacterium helvum]